MDQSEQEGWLQLISLSAGSAYWTEATVEWLSPLPHFPHLTANQTVVVLVLRSVRLWKRWETVYSACPFTYTIAREAERGRLLKSRWRPSILHLQLAAIVQSHYSRVSFPIHSKLSLSYRFHFCAALGSYRHLSQHALQSSGCLTWLKVIEVLYPRESAASSKQFESEALHLFFQPSTLAVLNEALFLGYSDCRSYKEWTIQGERIERTAKHSIH